MRDTCLSIWLFRFRGPSTPDSLPCTYPKWRGRSARISVSIILVLRKASARWHLAFRFPLCTLEALHRTHGTGQSVI